MSSVDFKIILIGDEFCGKTSLLNRFVHQQFDEKKYQNTIGAAFVSRSLKIGGKNVSVGIWDTAGADQYQNIAKIYYRNAKVAIFCFDKSNFSSFERVRLFYANHKHKILIKTVLKWT